MGKGDKKSKRGKIIMGSYGVSRPKRKAASPTVKVGSKKAAAPKKEAEPKKVAAKKSAPKKEAAPKKVAKKKEEK